MTPKWEYAQAFRAGDFDGMLRAAKRAIREKRWRTIRRYALAAAGAVVTALVTGLASWGLILAISEVRL